jgi:short-subunit dehydrogenase
MAAAARKTIAIFGAGPGLGAALAKCFGREGYRVALVARNAARLEAMVAELAGVGVEAVAFPADLTDVAGLRGLVETIEARLGPIDVATYAPVPGGSSRFVPAVDLDAEKLAAITPIFMFAPIELAHVLLRGMVARGDGAIIVVGGATMLVPKVGLGGVGSAMAATRNYLILLNAELAAKGTGVFAGTVTIGALIARSAIHRAIESSGVTSHRTLLDPDDIARDILALITKRESPELVVGPLNEDGTVSTKGA